ncbi:RHS repeat domain-containing protein [Arenimonas aestuarii]
MRKLFAFALTLMLAGTTHAQSGKAPWEEVDKRIKASEKVAPLGNNAFGDEVSLSNGALSFSAVDVSIPGNNGLPVAFGRSYSVRDRRYYTTDAMLADWDIQLPQISGVFATDWLAEGGSTNRCSSQTPPPMPAGGYLLSDVWSGLNLNIPGVGGGELLKTESATTKPSTGGPWLWIAGEQIHVSCLTTIQNGTGQGFLAITPDGTKYWFDWMAQHYEPPLRRATPTQGLPTGEVPTNRRKNVLYATRIEDRFGNWVQFKYSNAWNQPGRLNAGTSQPAITSSDGRTLSVTYNASGHIATVSDGSRTWSYTYGSLSSGRKTLTQVTLPDNSAWNIAFGSFTTAEIQYTEAFAPGETYRTCTVLEIPLNYASEPVGTITHPAGAIGTFTVNIKEHGRSKVTLNCGNVTTQNDPNDDANLFAISYHAFTLKSKQVSGPALATATWNYAYTSGKSVHRYPGTTFMNPVCVPWHSGMNVPYYNCWDPPCDEVQCAGSSTTVVTGPNNEWSRYTYGNTFRFDEGKLKTVEVGVGEVVTGNAIRTTLNEYDLDFAAAAPYPTRFGTGMQVNYASFPSEYHRPLITRTITQQGENFVWAATDFDALARPTEEYRASTLGQARTDRTTYYDHAGKWVMGQVANTRNVETGVYTSRTGFNTSSLLPTHFYTPGTTTTNGLLVQTLTYNSDGTVASVKDGNNNTTALSNWYRGIPRTVTFPGSVTQTATVNAHGFVTSVKDELNNTTTYGHDALGRMTSLTHPTGDTVSWAPTTIAYAKVASTEYGIPAGHWRQTVTRGNYRKIIYFDALWRPVIEREYDNAAVTATQRFLGWKYDHEGRVSFAGYPRSTATSIASFGTTGTSTLYDALGRPTSVSQTADGGPAVTLYEYQSNFVTKVRNPLNVDTLTSFQAFDTPTTGSPLTITAAVGKPEQQITRIDRDVLGKPESVEREGVYGGATLSLTRSYVYDIHQRLCKRIEPETGATLVEYDGAQNIAWTAEGSALTTSACNRGSVPTSERILRSYDSRNRLTLVDYPDSTPDVATTYTADGKVATISRAPTLLTYSYNKRGLLTFERLEYGSINWLTSHSYDTLGNLAASTYPSGIQVPYAPNALGQATQAGPYATGATYHPNGALAGFTYGNGIVHTMTQNLRQLPERSKDALGTNVILDDSYDYDLNGNVAGISDALSGQPGNRTMTYDALDRLVGVVAGTAQGGNGTFAYDPLDNLRVLDQGSRKFRYVYDANNRLDEIRSPGGTLLHSFTYDARGNTINKDGGGLVFDRENRLTSSQIPTATSYVYDGLGRRVREFMGASTYFYYGQGGKLLYTNDLKTSNRTDHIYLAGSLVANRKVPFGSNPTIEVTYQHTDALGSPVATTNQSGTLLPRERMTAWGEPADGTWSYGPGYTGHQMDAASKLVYMQQRYYDPAIGKFLSVDPVEAHPGSGANFNRYRYAANNPYRFTDPDGRLEKLKEEPPPPPETTVLPTVEVTASKPPNKATSIALPAPLPATPKPVTLPKIEVTVSPRAGPFLLMLFWPSELGAPACEMPDNPPCGMMMSGAFPPGFWPGDAGAAEWGKRNGVGEKEGKDKFHRGVKEHTPGARGDHDFGVNPKTGEVIDQNGEPVGNLNDE